ncbi:fungal-specific transcription factor domain-containing protein [Mycena galopus ATCC 62051]|nr:fungal-specific transcription factor domain-containing protein [Mycena galopus ATCC 62051]
MASDSLADDEHSPNSKSYSQDPPRTAPPRKKQRRHQKSCDICRERKTRCDGTDMPDGCCSNCLAFGSACTYVQPHKKRGPRYTNMPENLKNEIASLKAKLRALSVCSLCAQPLQSQPLEKSPSEVSVFQHYDGSASLDSKEPPDERDLATDELATHFSQFSLVSSATVYLGAASSFALANNASMMKEKYFGSSSVATHSRRPYFWQALPWEKEALYIQPRYVYPADDLIASLLELYFSNFHPTLPILHRPSFERSVAEGLHLTDMAFGGTLLATLAIASRYSKDPRVFADNGAPLSAGWKFATQLWGARRFFEPTIHEVQMYGLLSVYVLGTSASHASWVYIGLGIRCLQSRGEHMRKPQGHKWSLQDELWKRAFWSLFALERIRCLFLGRPMGLHIEEYNTELPLAVDDEYWDQGFVQPPGIPSKMSYFVCHLQLCEILSDAMRRLYGSKKAKMAMGWDGPEWEQRAVAELDSTMNRFLDSIPSHLHWNAENPPQGTFFDQSATLHITYNYVLTAIHRRYIQRAWAPSLSICASAARNILNTANIWLSKRQRMPLINDLNPVFVSGVILVLYMLGTKRAGLSMDKNKDLVCVATALKILKFAEARSQPAGRAWELLRELSTLDGLLPMEAPPRDESDSGISGSGIPIPTPSPTNVANEYCYSQLEQSSDSHSVPAGDQTDSMHGKSINELLAWNGHLSTTMEGILDDEFMSMWMAAPTDVE